MVITTSDGHEAARATTGTDGRWGAELPVGGYRLTPQPISSVMGVAPPTQFTVTAGGPPVGLDVTYDTGIR
jgi:hypothetical protein